MSVQRLKRVLVGRGRFAGGMPRQHLLHNQTALFIKGVLLFRKGVIVTNVPYQLAQ